jgi:hypothetical protein
LVFIFARAVLLKHYHELISVEPIWIVFIEIFLKQGVVVLINFFLVLPPLEFAFHVREFIFSLKILDFLYDFRICWWYRNFIRQRFCWSRIRLLLHFNDFLFEIIIWQSWQLFLFDNVKLSAKNNKHSNRHTLQ